MRYFTALKTDLPTNKVGRHLAGITIGVVFLYAMLTIGMIFMSGGHASFANPMFFAIPVTFILMTVTHLLLRPFVRICYKQL